MFAIFSVGVTLFASSSSFPFVYEDDTNEMHKLNFLIDFENSTATIKEREKFILYNAELAQDNRKLTSHGNNLDYTESKRMYDDFIDSTSHNEKAFLSLVMIPVYYNAGEYTTAKDTLKKIKEIEIRNPNIKDEFISISEINLTISDMLKKESNSKNYTNKKFSNEEKIMMKYWYADYTINKLPEFPGCKTEIFPKKIAGDSNESHYKCTHKELRFINDYIDDLNQDSYYFNIGNKYQQDDYLYYQDEILGFFTNYMNWLIIGVVFIVLIGWTSISKRQETIQVV